MNEDELVFFSFRPSEYEHIPPECMMKSRISKAAGEEGLSLFWEERLHRQLPWTLEISPCGGFLALLLDGLLRIVDLSRSLDERSVHLKEPFLADPLYRQMRWIGMDRNLGLLLVNGRGSKVDLYNPLCEHVASFSLSIADRSGSCRVLALLCPDANSALVVYSDSSYASLSITSGKSLREGRLLEDGLTCEHCHFLPERQLLVIVAHALSSTPSASAGQSYHIVMFALEKNSSGELWTICARSKILLPRPRTPSRILPAAENGRNQDWLTTVKSGLLGLWNNESGAYGMVLHCPVLDIVCDDSNSHLLLLHSHGLVTVLALDHSPNLSMHLLKKSIQWVDFCCGTQEASDSAMESKEVISSLSFLSKNVLAAFSSRGEMSLRYVHWNGSGDISLLPVKVRALPPALGLLRCRSVFSGVGPCRIAVLRYIDEMTYNVFTLTRMTSHQSIVYNLEHDHISEALEIAHFARRSEDEVYVQLYNLIESGRLKSFTKTAEDVLRLIQDNAFVMRAALLYCGGEVAMVMKVVREGLLRSMIILAPVLSRANEHLNQEVNGDELTEMEETALLHYRLLLLKFNKLRIVEQLLFPITTALNKEEGPVFNSDANIDNLKLDVSLVSFVREKDSNAAASTQTALAMAKDSDDTAKLAVLLKDINLFLAERTEAMEIHSIDQLCKLPAATLREFCFYQENWTALRLILRLYPMLRSDGGLARALETIRITSKPDNYLSHMVALLCEDDSVDEVEELVEPLLDLFTKEVATKLLALFHVMNLNQMNLDEQIRQDLRDGQSTRASFVEEEVVSRKDLFLSFLLNRAVLLDAFGFIYHSLDVMSFLVDFLSSEQPSSRMLVVLEEAQVLLERFRTISGWVSEGILPDRLDFFHWLFLTSPEEKVALVVGQLFSDMNTAGGDTFILTLHSLMKELCSPTAAIESMFHRLVDNSIVFRDRFAQEGPRVLEALSHNEAAELIGKYVIRAIRPYNRDHFQNVTALVAHYIDFCEKREKETIIESPRLLCEIVVLAAVLVDDLDVIQRLLLPMLQGLIHAINESSESADFYNDFYVEQCFELKSLLLGSKIISQYLSVPPLSIICPHFTRKVSAHVLNDPSLAHVVDERQQYARSKLYHYRFKKELANGCGYMGQSLLYLLDSAHFDLLFFYNNSSPPAKRHRRPNARKGLGIVDKLMTQLSVAELVVLKMVSNFVEESSKEKLRDYGQWIKLAEHLIILNNNSILMMGSKSKSHRTLLSYLLLIAFFHHFEVEFVRGFLLYYYYHISNDTANDQVCEERGQEIAQFVDNLRYLNTNSVVLMRVLLLRVKDRLYTNPLLDPADLECADFILDVLSSAESEEEEAEMDNLDASSRSKLLQIVRLEKCFVRLFLFLCSHNVEFLPLNLRLLPPHEIHSYLLFGHPDLYYVLLGIDQNRTKDCCFLSISTLNHYLSLLAGCCADLGEQHAVEVAVLVQLITSALQLQDVANLFLLLQILLNNYSLSSFPELSETGESGAEGKDVLQVVVTAIAFLSKQNLTIDLDLSSYAQKITCSSQADQEVAFSSSSTSAGRRMWEELCGLYMAKCPQSQLDLLLKKHHFLRGEQDSTHSSLEEGFKTLDRMVNILLGNASHDSLVDMGGIRYEVIGYFLSAEDLQRTRVIEERVYKMMEELYNRLQANAYFKALIGHQKTVLQARLGEEETRRITEMLVAKGFSDFVAKKCIRQVLLQGIADDNKSGKGIYEAALLVAIEQSVLPAFDYPKIITEDPNMVFSYPRRDIREECLALHRALEELTLVLEALQNLGFTFSRPQVVQVESVDAEKVESNSGRSSSSQRLKERMLARKMQKQQNKLSLGAVKLSHDENDDHQSDLEVAKAEKGTNEEIAVKEMLTKSQQMSEIVISPENGPVNEGAVVSSPLPPILPLVKTSENENTVEEHQTKEEGKSTTLAKEAEWRDALEGREGNVQEMKHSLENLNRCGEEQGGKERKEDDEDEEGNENCRADRCIEDWIPVTQMTELEEIVEKEEEEEEDNISVMLFELSDYLGISLPIETMTAQIHCLMDGGSESSSEEANECVCVLYKVLTLLVLDLGEDRDSFLFVQNRFLKELQNDSISAILLTLIVEDKFSVQSLFIPLFMQELFSMESVYNRLLFVVALWRYEIVFEQGQLPGGEQMLTILRTSPTCFLLGLNILYERTDAYNLFGLLALKQEASDLLADCIFEKDILCKFGVVDELAKSNDNAVQAAWSKLLSEDVLALKRLDRLQKALPCRANVKCLLLSSNLLAREGDRSTAVKELIQLLSLDQSLHLHTALAKHLKLTKSELYALCGLKSLQTISTASSDNIESATTSSQTMEVVKCLQKVKELSLKAVVVCVIVGLNLSAAAKTLGLEMELQSLSAPSEFLVCSLDAQERDSLLAKAEEIIREQHGKALSTEPQRGYQYDIDGKLSISLAPLLIHLSVVVRKRLELEQLGLLSSDSFAPFIEGTQRRCSIVMQATMRVEVSNDQLHHLYEHLLAEDELAPLLGNPFLQERVPASLSAVLEDCWTKCLDDRLANLERLSCSWTSFEQCYAQFSLLHQRCLALSPVDDRSTSVAVLANVVDRLSKTLKASSTVTVLGALTFVLAAFRDHTKNAKEVSCDELQVLERCEALLLLLCIQYHLCVAAAFPMTDNNAENVVSDYCYVEFQAWNERTPDLNCLLRELVGKMRISDQSIALLQQVVRPVLALLLVKLLPRENVDLIFSGEGSGVQRLLSLHYTDMVEEAHLFVVTGCEAEVGTGRTLLMFYRCCWEGAVSSVPVNSSSRWKPLDVSILWEICFILADRLAFQELASFLAIDLPLSIVSHRITAGNHNTISLLNEAEKNLFQLQASLSATRGSSIEEEKVRMVLLQLLQPSVSCVELQRLLALCSSLHNKHVHADASNLLIATQGVALISQCLHNSDCKSLFLARSLPSSGEDVSMTGEGREDLFSDVLFPGNPLGSLRYLGFCLEGHDLFDGGDEEELLSLLPATLQRRRGLGHFDGLLYASLLVRITDPVQGALLHWVWSCNSLQMYSPHRALQKLRTSLVEAVAGDRRCDGLRRNLYEETIANLQALL